MSSQKRRPSCFFFCCLQQLLWCLCKQAPFPEAISALEIWAQQLPAGRDMGPEAHQDGEDGRGQPGWGGSSRRQCTPGLPCQCVRSSLRSREETQALKCQRKQSVSFLQRWEPGIPCLLNFTLFLTLNRILELRSR